MIAPRAASNIQIERVTYPQALEALAGAWDALVLEAGASVFQTYEWNLAWWKVFGDGNAELCVLLAKDEEGTLVGIAPLEFTPNGILRFIGGGNHSSDYCDWIVRPGTPGVVQAFLMWIERREVPWRELDFFNLPETSPHRAALEDYLRGRVAGMGVERITDAPARGLENAEENKEALNKKSLKRHFNSFNKSGKLEFRSCESIEEVERWFPSFFQQHIERRADTGAPSLFLDPDQKEFYGEVLRSLFPKGWLSFTVVTFDGEPIAFHFGFIFGDKFIWYKPAFNMKYAKRSPGEVLIKFLLEHAIERGLKEFDFTVGEEGFKYRFANRIRGNYRVRVFRSRFAYGRYRTKRVLKDLLLRHRARPASPASDGEASQNAPSSAPREEQA